MSTEDGKDDIDDLVDDALVLDAINAIESAPTMKALREVCSSYKQQLTTNSGFAQRVLCLNCPALDLLLGLYIPANNRMFQPKLSHSATYPIIVDAFKEAGFVADIISSGITPLLQLCCDKGLALHGSQDAILAAARNPSMDMLHLVMTCVYPSITGPALITELDKIDVARLKNTLKFASSLKILHAVLEEFGIFNKTGRLSALFALPLEPQLLFYLFVYQDKLPPHILSDYQSQLRDQHLTPILSELYERFRGLNLQSLGTEILRSLCAMTCGRDNKIVSNAFVFVLSRGANPANINELPESLPGM